MPVAGTAASVVLVAAGLGAAGIGLLQRVAAPAGAVSRSAPGVITTVAGNGTRRYDVDINGGGRRREGQEEPLVGPECHTMTGEVGLVAAGLRQPRHGVVHRGLEDDVLARALRTWAQQDGAGEGRPRPGVAVSASRR
jgi:hypothetical protein